MGLDLGWELSGWEEDKGKRGVKMIKIFHIHV
jgi:hypothetical protein